MYYDLSQDEELFQGEGDYQFEMYRMMRSQCGNNWQNFTPKNNVVWIHYLTEKALNASKGYRYLRAPRQSAFDLLQELESSVLAFDSCYELVQAMCGPQTAQFPLLRKSKLIRAKK
uniref:non-specific serine/threonine protein kinase n=1 Tax=Cacopsylla melanoneura TaxID=428564 RepID=A0A8D8W1I5_9HEMI